MIPGIQYAVRCGTINSGLKMIDSRRLLALLIAAALLCAALAPAAFGQSPAILVPLVLFCVCLTTVLMRRVPSRCSLPPSPFCPLFGSRSPPVR